MEESLTLNLEHQAALRQGKSVPVVEKATQLDCVVVRADVFERIRMLVPDFDPREAYSALDEVMGEDWNDPRMAEYDNYELHKRCLNLATLAEDRLDKVIGSLPGTMMAKVTHCLKVALAIP